MSLFQLGDVFGYQDANGIKILWAGSTAPAEPGEGEVWLDISLTPCRLKRYTGSGWDIIGEHTAQQILDLLKTVDGTGSGLDADLLGGNAAGSYLRSDTDASYSGTLTSSITSGAAIKFDDGHSLITVHDGNGNFNIKSGVDENHEIIVSDGGSRIELSESGKISLFVSASPVGSTFTDDVSLQLTSSGVNINGQTVWHGGNMEIEAGTAAGSTSGQINTFSNAFSQTPAVIVTPKSANSGVCYVTNVTTSSFKIVTPSANTFCYYVAIVL